MVMSITPDITTIPPSQVNRLGRALFIIIIIIIIMIIIIIIIIVILLYPE